jgi:hypothetical protein
MITLTRRLTVAVAVLALAAAGAGCGRSGDDDSDVASIDDSSAAAAPDEEADDGGGSSGPGSQEFQDAMLEYAECMRDHGIDMPDPEFQGDGGVTQMMPEGEAGGPGPSEEFEAADEACQPIIEDAMPEAEELSPEEQAERQDQMVAMAECMRDKGYDMPDPQVDSNGRVRIERRGSPSSDTGPQEDQEQFQEDMEACSEEAGLPDSPVGGGGGVTRGSGG